MIKKYVDGLIQVIEQIPFTKVEQLVESLRLARSQGNTIFVFGNGGSATTAAHLACDLGKSTVKNGEPRFRVITLHEPATLTAYANDVAYGSVFSEPLRSLGQAGDIALGISCSGNSENVLQAMMAARELGMKTVGLTGFQGGKMAKLVDQCIIVPSEDMQHLEDAHLIMCHALFRALL